MEPTTIHTFGRSSSSSDSGAAVFIVVHDSAYAFHSHRCLAAVELDPPSVPLRRELYSRSPIQVVSKENLARLNGEERARFPSVFSARGLPSFLPGMHKARSLVLRGFLAAQSSSEAWNSSSDGPRKKLSFHSALFGKRPPLANAVCQLASVMSASPGAGRMSAERA